MNLNRLRTSIENIKNITEQNNKAEEPKEIENIIISIKKASYINKNHLQDKINNIKCVFLNNWEKENIPFIRKIVENININEGIPLPVLTICGQGTQEIRFTKYLAYFLDPHKKHGLDDKVLKAFIGPELKMSEVDLSDTKETKVTSELKLGTINGNDKEISSFVDIAIEGNDYIIILEQKILSSESKHPDSDMNQLERYSFTLDNNPNYNNKKKIKIYLTPKKVIKRDSYGWIYLTHKDLIERGIKLLKLGEVSNVGKKNLSRFLIDLAVGPYEVLEESLDEIIVLGNELLNKNFNLEKFVRFNNLVEENDSIIEIIMEG